MFFFFQAKSVVVFFFVFFFAFLHEITCCAYSFEAPRGGISNEYQQHVLMGGASNEYPQHMFSWRNKKNIYLLSLNHGMPSLTSLGKI